MSTSRLLRTFSISATWFMTGLVNNKLLYSRIENVFQHISYFGMIEVLDGRTDTFKE